MSRIEKRLKLEIAPPLIAGLISGLHRTCRIRVLGNVYQREIIALRQPVLLTSWHAAFPAVIYSFSHSNGLLMVSRSTDGEMIARALSRMGYQTVRGSSHRGGARALKEMLRLVRRGYSGGFIADGSQGPAQIAQMGIVLLARHTRVPLFPIAMAARPCIRFPSWDRTVLAVPLSRVVLAVGAPRHIPSKASSQQMEQYRLRLEADLNRLTQEAETIVQDLARFRRLPPLARFH